MRPSAQRSFAQPTACPHVPARLTPEPAKREARKRRASERHAVGCCEELASPHAQAKTATDFLVRLVFALALIRSRITLKAHQPGIVAVIAKYKSVIPPAFLVLYYFR